MDAQAVPRADATADFVGNGNEEGLVSNVGGELILMQGERSDLFQLKIHGVIFKCFRLNRRTQCSQKQHQSWSLRRLP